MFRSVGEMKLKTFIEHFSLDLVPEEESRLNELGVLRVTGKSIFSISSHDLLIGYITAGSMYLSEDDLSYGEPTAIGNKELSGHVIKTGYYNS
jgi:hypothetical protein